MTTTEALRTHRLVTARMRVIRYEGSPAWTVAHVDGIQIIDATTLIDALAWAQEGVK